MIEKLRKTKDYAELAHLGLADEYILRILCLGELDLQSLAVDVESN